jgi:predicted trehalose synthase
MSKTLDEIELLRRDLRRVEELAGWLLAYRRCLSEKIAALENESERRMIQRIFGDRP